MRISGIERQTQLLALLPILAIAALLVSYFIYTRFDDLDRALLERSKLLARQLASASEYPVFSGNTALLKQYVGSALSSQDVQAVVILDAASDPILKAGQVEQALAAPHSAMPQLDQDNNLLRLYEPISVTQIKLDDIDPDVDTDRVAAKPLGMVIIEFSKARLNRQKTEVVIFNMLATLIILSATLIIALRVARRITEPILGMRQAIIRIGEGALDTRISPKPQVRELFDLADGINKMAAQLQLDRSTLQERIDQATLEIRAKKEEAERSSASKTRFLAAASHDLRQPMHALGLFVGELQATVNTREQREMVMKVEESVNAMSGLLNSLLDISKLDAGVIIPQVRNFNIETSLRRIQQDYCSLAEGKSIQFRVVPCSMSVRSDPVLLERILVNLVSNALRYTPTGGRVLLGCRKRGNNLRIEVRDNGIGIPSDEQQSIFLEFVQLANKERDRSMGLGLGLAIVDRLSRLLHHPVSVHSEIGRGSKFTIDDIPLAANSVTPHEIEPHEIEPHEIEPHEIEPHEKEDRANNAQPPDDQACSRILVVDDDPLVRSSTQAILSSWGYQVYAAKSLQEVKNDFAQQDIDLVICDYRLPDGTGLDVINFVSLSNQSTPCILVSGDTSPDVLQKVTENGLNLLSKPVRPAKLRTLVQSLLNESKRSE